MAFTYERPIDGQATVTASKAAFARHLGVDVCAVLDAALDAACELAKAERRRQDAAHPFETFAPTMQAARAESDARRAEEERDPRFAAAVNRLLDARGLTLDGPSPPQRLQAASYQASLLLHFVDQVDSVRAARSPYARNAAATAAETALATLQDNIAASRRDQGPRVPATPLPMAQA
jgi:post-segregation antitoxin (ccd killing protein)